MLTVKIKRAVIPITAVIVSLYFMFKMPDKVAFGVTDGFKICFYTLLPSLFPFMVLSSYIVKSDVLSPVYKFLSPVMKALFKQPPCSASVIVMSLIGGFPVGAKMTRSLYEGGKITENQAKRLNCFCINAGPAFAVTAVGASMYRSVRAGAVIYASLCLSSILFGIITSFFGDEKAEDKKSVPQIQSPLSSLSASVTDSVQAVLGICAWVVLFGAITACLKETVSSDAVYRSLVCVLEVTKGCTLSVGHFSIPAVTAIIGFGGICVHCQVFSFLKLRYRHFFVSRALNASLSALICQGLLYLFPVDVQTALQDGKLMLIPFSVSAPAFFAVILMCIVMIFDIDSKKKVW